MAASFALEYGGGDSCSSAAVDLGPFFRAAADYQQGETCASIYVHDAAAMDVGFITRCIALASASALILAPSAGRSDCAGRLAHRRRASTFIALVSGSL